MKTLQRELDYNVREWYMITYPHDTLGADIDPNITLWELYEAVRNNEDFYKILGVGDSLIRERLFEIISELLQVDYDVIYYMWLNIPVRELEHRRIIESLKER